MRILIIKLSSIGDLFHALPAVRMIKAGTGAEIHWCVNSGYASLVSCFTDVDHVIPFPRHSLLKDGPAFLAAVRRSRYDWILDLQGLMKSALVCRCARGAIRLGPSFHREGSRILYSRVAGPRNLNRHAVEQILDAVDALQIARTEPSFPVRFPTVPPPPARPNIAIAPISRWPSKNWPIGRFAAVARALQLQKGGCITLLGAPGEEDACRQIEKSLEGPCRNLSGKTSLPEMGAELAQADVLLANDSGPVHMAAAVATPTVVVFGPTNPTRIGPYGKGHKIITPAHPCQCNRKRICAHPDNPCIKQISVEHVQQALLSLLP